MTNTTAIAIRDDQVTFDDLQKKALTHLGVDRATPADLAVFFHTCKRTGLDPFARQIYMIERQGKQTIQTGIDGFRLVARRAVDRTGETLAIGESLWCGPDGQWTDVWLSEDPPAAAKVTVYRNGQAFPATALWREYAQTKRDGSLTAMWQARPAGQLAKCAEALALRKAFPQDLSGLYTTDEIAHEHAGAQPQQKRVTATDFITEPVEQVDTVTGEVIIEDPPADGDWPEPAPVGGDQ